MKYEFEVIMKLYEIIDIALTYLNLSDEIKVIGLNRTPITNKKLKVLLRCANIIYSEIASDYMPLKAKETITVDDNIIKYSVFSKRIIDIVKILKDNQMVNFTLYPNYIEVNAEGDVEVIYNYLPNEITLDDDIAYGIKLSPITFAAGVAGEYALVMNMYEEALAFERKFKEGIINNVSEKKSRYLKKRRWF